MDGGTCWEPAQDPCFVDLGSLAFEQPAIAACVATPAHSIDDALQPVEEIKLQCSSDYPCPHIYDASIAVSHLLRSQSHLTTPLRLPSAMPGFKQWRKNVIPSLKMEHGSCKTCHQYLCVYVCSTDPRLILCIFVNDGLTCGVKTESISQDDDGLPCSVKNKNISQFLGEMKGAFNITERDPKMYVGLHISRDRVHCAIQIVQQRYVEPHWGHCHWDFAVEPSFSLLLITNSVCQHGCHYKTIT